MKIVIDISESIFNSAKHHYLASDISVPELLEEFTKALKNGTSLPQGHGRLIDAELLRRDIHTSYSDDLGILEHIDNTPAAIEADKEME